MICFRFPKKWCKEVNAAIVNFWWGQHDNEKKIHWKCWVDLTQLKGQEGMGFRDLEDFNTAMLAKMAWRFLNNHEAFWVKIPKGLYFSREVLLKARNEARVSWC